MSHNLQDLDFGYVKKKRNKNNTYASGGSGGNCRKTHKEKAHGKRYVFSFEANSTHKVKYKDTLEGVITTYNTMVKKYGKVIRPIVIDVSGDTRKYIKFKDIIE